MSVQPKQLEADYPYLGTCGSVGPAGACRSALDTAGRAVCLLPAGRSDHTGAIIKLAATPPTN